VLHVRPGSIANQCEAAILIFRLDARRVDQTAELQSSDSNRSTAEPMFSAEITQTPAGWRLVMISGNNVNNPFVPVRTRTHTLFMNMWVNIVCRCENFCSDCQSIRLYIIRSSRQDSFLFFCCFFFFFFFLFFFVVRSSFIPFRFKRFFLVLSLGAHLYSPRSVGDCRWRTRVIDRVIERKRNAECNCISFAVTCREKNGSFVSTQSAGQLAREYRLSRHPSRRQFARNEWLYDSCDTPTMREIRHWKRKERRKKNKRNLEIRIINHHYVTRGTSLLISVSRFRSSAWTRTRLVDTYHTQEILSHWRVSFPLLL